MKSAVKHLCTNNVYNITKVIARSDWSVSHYHLPVGARQETELAR